MRSMTVAADGKKAMVSSHMPKMWPLHHYTMATGARTDPPKYFLCFAVYSLGYLYPFVLVLIEYLAIINSN